MKKLGSVVGFGGGCHWCTEAVFQSVPEVLNVEQGWIRSVPPHDTYSEAVLVHFNENEISLPDLIAIHISTHSATSNHSMRSKYRSAIYTFNDDQREEGLAIISSLQHKFQAPIITQVLPFRQFKLNQEDYLNYYHNNPDKPFCKTYIQPKLQMLENLVGK